MTAAKCSGPKRPGRPIDFGLDDVDFGRQVARDLEANFLLGTWGLDHVLIGSLLPLFVFQRVRGAYPT